MTLEEIRVAKKWGHKRLETWYDIPREERAAMIAAERQEQKLQHWIDENVKKS